MVINAFRSTPYLSRQNQGIGLCFAGARIPQVTCSREKSVAGMEAFALGVSRIATVVRLCSTYFPILEKFLGRKVVTSSGGQQAAI